MSLRARLARAVLLFMLALGGATGAGASSWSTDVTDIWWNPDESGWGINFVQTGSFVFATLFVYASDGKPVWIAGQLRGAEEPETIRFTGPLSYSTGPFFGGSFDPALVTRREAGTMTLVLDTVSTGQLSYTLDGVTVTKRISRQPLTHDDYAGEYRASFTYTTGACTDASKNVTRTVTGAMSIRTQADVTTATIPMSDASTCTIHGSYAQAGRTGSISGTYACTGGASGAAQMFQMTGEPWMFMAYVDFYNGSDGCATQGELVGLKPRP